MSQVADILIFWVLSTDKWWLSSQTTLHLKGGFHPEAIWAQDRKGWDSARRGSPIYAASPSTWYILTAHFMLSFWSHSNNLVTNDFYSNGSSCCLCLCCHLPFPISAHPSISFYSEKAHWSCFWPEGSTQSLPEIVLHNHMHCKIALGYFRWASSVLFCPTYMLPTSLTILHPLGPAPRPSTLKTDAKSFGSLVLKLSDAE